MARVHGVGSSPNSEAKNRVLVVLLEKSIMGFSQPRQQPSVRLASGSDRETTATALG
jgi:hypothetical protein